MASRDLTYSVGVDATDAVSGLKKLESAVRSTMRDVESELDEGASAGDKFAASVDKLAASMRSDFDSAATAAGELQRALAEVDSTLDVGDAIAELNRMGFTFQEITADADRFAASLKQLDDVRLDGVKQLDKVAPGLATKLDDVGKSADSSKSVLANMVGNSTQDIGELGGIAGTAGVAIGQMGEYMVDAAAGGEKLRSVIGSFATLAVPIAAVLVGVQGFQEKLKNAAAVKAFRKEEVEDYAAALEEADSTLGAVIAKLREGDGLQLNIFGKDEDVTAAFNRLGVGLSEASELIAGGREEIDAWASTMRDAGADADDLALATLALARNAEDLEEAERLAAETTKFLGGESKQAGEFIAKTGDAMASSEGWARKYEAALRDQTEATDAARKANEKLRGDLDDRQAYLSLMDTFDALEAAGVEAMTAVATGAANAEQATRDYEQQQLAAKEELLLYLDALEDVPPEKTSEILALIDEGSLAEAKRELDLLTMRRNMDVYIRAQIDPRLEDSRFGPIRTGRTSSSSPQGFAADVAPMSASVVQHTTNVTVNLPRSDDGRSVRRELDRWSRINGDEG